MFGIVQGLQPIIGYNFGAKQPERVRLALKTGIKVAVGISTLGFILLMFFTDTMISIFNNDPELLKVGTHALRVVKMCIRDSLHPYCHSQIMPWPLVRIFVPPPHRGPAW